MKYVLYSYLVKFNIKTNWKTRFKFRIHWLLRTLQQNMVLNKRTDLQATAHLSLFPTPCSFAHLDVSYTHCALQLACPSSVLLLSHLLSQVTAESIPGRMNPENRPAHALECTPHIPCLDWEIMGQLDSGRASFLGPQRLLVLWEQTRTEEDQSRSLRSTSPE